MTLSLADIDKLVQQWPDRRQNDMIEWDCLQLFTYEDDSEVTVLITGYPSYNERILKRWDHILSDDEVRTVLEKDWSKLMVLL